VIFYPGVKTWRENLAGLFADPQFFRLVSDALERIQ
jgi:hypothetical protein